MEEPVKCQKTTTKASANNATVKSVLNPEDSSMLAFPELPAAKSNGANNDNLMLMDFPELPAAPSFPTLPEKSGGELLDFPELPPCDELVAGTPGEDEALSPMKDKKETKVEPTAPR